MSEARLSYLENESTVDLKQCSHEEKLRLLTKFCDEHPLWENPLLHACKKGVLRFKDFQFLFSQYYLYSKNFTRFLAAVMVNCESDYYRSLLSENLWEEGGGIEVEKRHAEIFRVFLKKHLKLSSLEQINFLDYTTHFVAQYLKNCLHVSALEASAALSFGTEAIVPKLYRFFREGLLQAGLRADQLNFFDLHIACDDAHADTLQSIVLSYQHEPNWYEYSKKAMLTVLDLRHEFFLRLYDDICEQQAVDRLIDRASLPPKVKVTPDVPLFPLKSTTEFVENVLYQNKDDKLGINFCVQRLPFKGDILDPRLVLIQSGQCNELHQHAHETVMLFLAGCGEVIVDKERIPVKANDILFIPRWFKHQTRNTGDEDLRFFAVTDYRFTRCFKGNTESNYRINKSKVL